jgi:putative nucleotidyltransferase with HDIG domain
MTRLAAPPALHGRSPLRAPWAVRSDPIGIKYPQSSEDPQSSYRRNRRLTRLQARLRHAHLDSVMALVAAVEAKDPYTRRHSMNVSVYAEKLAQSLDLKQGEIEMIKIAGVLHDVGKIGMPDSVLTKPGKLSPVEMKLMREHPVIGAAILKPVIFLNRERPLVLHHHEWFNGNGYPEGLSGEKIPLGARILHVADSIDAMLSPRTYKAAYCIERTVDEIKKGSGTQFDPQVSAAAIHWISQNETLINRLGQLGIVAERLPS